MHCALHALCSVRLVLVGFFPSWFVHFSSAPRVLHAPPSCVVLLGFITLKLWTAGITIELILEFFWPFSFYFLSLLSKCALLYVILKRPYKKNSIRLHDLIHTFVDKDRSVQTVGCVAACESCVLLFVRCLAELLGLPYFQRQRNRKQRFRHSSIRTECLLKFRRPSIRPSVRKRDTTLEIQKGIL